MITALVTFDSNPDRPEMYPKDKLSLYEMIAPKYQNIPSLICNYFMGSGDLAGGWYEWDAMDDAKAYYTLAWRQFITKAYGPILKIEDFDCPCAIDTTCGGVCIVMEVREAAEKDAPQ